VLNRRAPSALLGRYTWHLHEALHLEAMRTAAMELTGVHDFAAFGTPDMPGKSTVRRVDSIRIGTRKDCVLITVRGNAFLRQMVRAFVGTLVLAGQKRLTPEDVRRIRESGDRGRCPNIAPAQGLCLVRVEYGDLQSRYDDSGNRHDIIVSSNEILQDTDHEDLFGEAE
jgi:tRNA pseudouridine38-40 synthase